MIKSWPKLIISIILAQSAGMVGTFFTISSIPTWYAFLNKPTFSPPNWLFGPVWTILYTLIGISLYRILIKHEKETFWSVKLFMFHLIFNAIWSPVFFGLKNLGLAFFVIIIMDITLIAMVKGFYKIDKLASYLLIPYLIWISFASLLNYSIWNLNPNNAAANIFAQDFTFIKARSDYIFTEDNYKKDLFDFDLKKASYLKNPTLSNKEQVRIAAYKFIGSRNNYIKNYLTMLRIKTVESNGIEQSKKGEIYTKIDPEVVWYDSRKNSYNPADNLEDLISKSKDEDARFKSNSLPIIYFSLAHISLGEAKDLRSKHIKLYENFKEESSELIKLGRADASLFDRWFKDIDLELNNISNVEKQTETEIAKIFGADDYQKDSGYKKAIEALTPMKQNLLKLNSFVKELESVIANKR